MRTLTTANGMNYQLVNICECEYPYLFGTRDWCIYVDMQRGYVQGIVLAYLFSV